VHTPHATGLRGRGRHRRAMDAGRGMARARCVKRGTPSAPPAAAANRVARPSRDGRGKRRIPGNPCLRKHALSRGAGVVWASGTEVGSASFMEALKDAAMHLHRKDQATSGGQKAKERSEFLPTKEGYLRFLIDSRIVFSSLEDIVRDTDNDQRT